MATKDLPYFKFNVNRWITGDISLEARNIQGVFISICAFYWSKECDLSLDKVRRFLPSEDHEKLKQLLQSGIIKVDKKQNIHIIFLDEQYADNNKNSVKNSVNGSKGGAPKGNKNAAKETFSSPELKNNPKSSEKQPTYSTQNQAKTSNIEKRREEKNIYRLYLTFLNSETKKSYRGSEKSFSSFCSRIKEGYSLDDFKKAISNAVKNPYHIQEQYRYLTPEFFTRADKLDNFINQTPALPLSAAETPEQARERKQREFMSRI